MYRYVYVNVYNMMSMCKANRWFAHLMGMQDDVLVVLGYKMLALCVWVISPRYWPTLTHNILAFHHERCGMPCWLMQLELKQAGCYTPKIPLSLLCIGLGGNFWESGSPSQSQAPRKKNTARIGTDRDGSINDQWHVLPSHLSHSPWSIYPRNWWMTMTAVPCLASACWGSEWAWPSAAKLQNGSFFSIAK